MSFRKITKEQYKSLSQSCRYYTRANLGENSGGYSAALQHRFAYGEIIEPAPVEVIIASIQDRRGRS